MTRRSLPKAMRYGSVSILALANTIMLAGTTKAADTAGGNSDTSGSTGTNTVTPPKKTNATPAKPANTATTGAVTKLNTIVVTAKQEGSYQAGTASSPLYTEPLRDTPETITIVPQAVIKDQNATTLRDVLRNVPGISFQAGEGSSTVAGDNLSIRGFNARDDMFIGGIRDTGIYTLSGEQRVEGVEFDAAGSLTRDWKIFGGYVYMKSRVLSGPPSASPGNVLPNTPSQTASLWTTYDLPYNFTIGTGGQFVDQRYSLVNELNSSPGYWTQQAMLAYKVNRNVDVQLNVYNIWDKEYIDLVGAHQAVPGAGRTVVFTTNIRF